ncbi:DUF1801 domain-containing protein [Cryobacterium sp. 1639]|uniref:DUF1801 domain-containing protein n=1 Tax=Cryobacterium inferilacus TaxID=2866629 RepID=UPI001C73ABCB|nr:DUF1801 domain-containing protein [Cryobacterium sp. 1639]MBX0299275.1 DUF1801 domain-containing protein [Cryobacterium sp. 1639]
MATSTTTGTARNDGAKDGGFSAEERAAMKARAAELKADAKRGRAEDKAAADKATMMAKIAETPQPDRGMAERLHEIITAAAPELLPKLYYGQPGWSRAGGKVVVFFRSGQTDKERYSTLGFSADANLDDDGGMWVTAFALRELTEESAATISALVRKAVS